MQMLRPMRTDGPDLQVSFSGERSTPVSKNVTPLMQAFLTLPQHVQMAARRTKC